MVLKQLNIVKDLSYKVVMLKFPCLSLEYAKEVKRMCISHNEIERQAYIMSEKIRMNSIYKPIKLEFIGGESIDLKNNPLEDKLAGKDFPLVSKLILEDREGMRFNIEPNETGLSFAKGEITYKEYKQMQTKESRRFIGYLTALASGFLLISWIILRMFFI